MQLFHVKYVVHPTAKQEGPMGYKGKNRIRKLTVYKIYSLETDSTLELVETAALN